MSSYWLLLAKQHFYASVSVVALCIWAVHESLSVSPCVPNCLEKYWVYFHQIYEMCVHVGTGMKCQLLGSNGQSSCVHGHGGSDVLENALLALLIQYLENYLTVFH